MKLEVLERGTHEVRLREINNDIPSPCGIVAETLADLEYHIGAMVKDGGNDIKTQAQCQLRLAMLFASLTAASAQGWKLALTGDAHCGPVQQICRNYSAQLEGNR